MNDLNITVYRGGSLGRKASVPCTLHLYNELTSSVIDVIDGEQFYKAEAREVMRCLEQLPQGTRHQLLILMLQDAQNLRIHN
jgi:hypothetical protein